ncbi:MAG TPA: type II toxin-antitoxin system HicB family antitoxin [Bryobacteraceae bacterium]|nr:type II toxin-antitoxin system HicB family antitoxin [Bryobacteraceae bacterium]
MIEEERLEMVEYSYTVLFAPAEEGGFVVTCPALPGLVTEGDTLEEARAMAQDAIRAYLESLQKDHLQIPLDKMPVKEEVRVLLPESA